MWRWLPFQQEEEQHNVEQEEDEDEEKELPDSIKCLIILDQGESQIPMDVPTKEMQTLFDVFEFTEKAIHSGENPLSLKKIQNSRNVYIFDTVVHGRGVMIGFDNKANKCVDFDPKTVYLPSQKLVSILKNKKRITFE